MIVDWFLGAELLFTLFQPVIKNHNLQENESEIKKTKIIYRFVLGFTIVNQINHKL